MNKHKIKKRYLELRFGHQVIGPVIQLVNFIMIAYLAINEVIPIFIFAPLFVVAIAGAYTVIGHKFRNHQQATDLDLSYEKATEAGKTTYFIMLGQLTDMEARGITPPVGFVERMEYLKRIGEGKV